MLRQKLQGLLSQDSAKKVIAVNFLWLMAEKILLMGGALILSVVFARYLGSQDFGRYQYALSFVALFVPLFSLGMLNLLLREWAKTPDKMNVIIATCIRARLASGIFFTCLSAFALYYVYGLGWKFATLSLLLVSHISCAFEVFERWFQHKSLNHIAVKWRVCCFAIFAIIKLVSIYYGIGFIELLLIVAVEVLVRNLGYRHLYHRHRDDHNVGSFDSATLKHIWSQSKFVVFSSFATLIYLKIDVLMLEAMGPIEQVGIYSVATRISEVWYVLPQVLLTAFYPKLIDIAKQDFTRYERLLQQGFDYLVVMAVMIIVLTVAIAPWLIHLLFGDAYIDAGRILQLHIVACLFIYWRTLVSQYLVVVSFAQFSLFSHVSGALVNVALNYWLIPLYGPWGAAIATVVSYSVCSYFCLWIVPSTRKVAWMMTKSLFIVFRYKNLAAKL